MLNENMVELNRNYFADCREVLKNIPDKSINLFLEDMPYNTTQCDWEYEVDLEEYWKLRLPKLSDKGVFVLTASQPFTTDLIMSNRKMFKYEIVWDKVTTSNALNAKIMPMSKHENIIIFAYSGNTFNRQFTKREGSDLRPNRKLSSERRDKNITESTYGIHKHGYSVDNDYTQISPSSIIKFSRGNGWDKSKEIHPTQKPIELFSYLIKTYTNENDIVFDGYSGSGTTAIACIRNNRKYIICENKKEYYDLQTKRILEEIDKTSLFNSLGGRQDRISA